MFYFLVIAFNLSDIFSSFAYAAKSCARISYAMECAQKKNVQQHKAFSEKTRYEYYFEILKCKSGLHYNIEYCKAYKVFLSVELFAISVIFTIILF